MATSQTCFLEESDLLEAREENVRRLARSMGIEESRMSRLQVIEELIWHGVTKTNRNKMY